MLYNPLNVVIAGDGASDKIARDTAAKEAIIYFEKNPPKFVQKMKEKSKSFVSAFYLGLIFEFT